MNIADARVGDIVMLNSGGPPMTVVRIAPEIMDHGEVLVWCTWIGNDGGGHEHGFPAACISSDMVYADQK